MWVYGCRVIAERNGSLFDGMDGWLHKLGKMGTCVGWMEMVGHKKVEWTTPRRRSGKLRECLSVCRWVFCLYIARFHCYVLLCQFLLRDGFFLFLANLEREDKSLWFFVVSQFYEYGSRDDIVLLYKRRRKRLVVCPKTNNKAWLINF